ncbi:MAG: hypothetical protein IPP51_16545 [Bacteroidetes bacterium]|nr:hypothetical protein [Bacteroidota bacterium]
MRNQLLPILITIFFFIQSNLSKASHAAGAEFKYACLGNDLYQITYIFYRDCYGIPAPSIIDVQYSSSCAAGGTMNLTQVGNAIQVSPICSSVQTNCSGGTYFGIEKYVYSDTVTLPSPCADWVFTHSEVARNAAITTTLASGSNDLTVFCLINNTQNFCQMSPLFNSELTPFLYAGQPYCISPGVSYEPGDSLTYQLITPRTGPSPGDTVTFLSPYSVYQPVLSNPACTFDPGSGLFCCTPTQADVSILAILVNQYRNGILIGQVERDIQIDVLNSTNHQVTLSGFNNTPLSTLNVCENQSRFCHNFYC